MDKRKLFIVYNRALAKARKDQAADKVIQRLKLAFGILQCHEYYVAEKEQYQPTRNSCNCKDWEFHLSKRRAYTGPCKHMAAEILLERAEMITYYQTSF